MITEYIRNSRGEKRGVVVAIGKNDSSGRAYVRIGWSLCNKKDIFDKERGMSIACGRAIKSKTNEFCIGIPHTAINPIGKMVERAIRYFHTTNINIAQ